MVNGGADHQLLVHEGKCMLALRHCKVVLLHMSTSCCVIDAQ